MSPEMKQDLLNLGCLPAKIAVHYHGVPGNLIHIQKTDTTQKLCTILMLSYLDPVKGHLFALKALKAIAKQGVSEFKLRIVGAGHYEKQIKQFVSAHQLNPYVDFVGPVKYLSPAYFQEFSNADIFLHPSVKTKDDKEGIPGSLVEAMFAGLPVISTIHGGIPFVIQDKKTGLLVEEWDVENLACAIKALMDNRWLRNQIGNQARKYAESNLDLKIRELALEKIYNELIGN
ncbi:glycosyl transferase group 1 [Desulfotignum phosphitoxidans DSM 13687]|uniref:Glycosyl transferase group 1 n=2 Tax=Desulfotignum phosphitoxidans TaxID=190898 RepID=S0FRH0_9BACT|nr:glycosyl transferase group 1 [Desulfotignum phosphitoxidans DSM 13687]